MHKSNDFFAHVCNSKNKLQNKESGAVGDDFVQVVKPVFRSWYIHVCVSPTCILSRQVDSQEPEL